MPLVETLPIGADTAQWSVWGTVARIVVTDPCRLAEATDLVKAELAAVDAACSRFRDDSELRAACRAGGRPVAVGPLLAQLVAAALEAARDTDGRRRSDRGWSAMRARLRPGLRRFDQRR